MLASNKTAIFWYRLILGLIGWIAIILQYSLMVSAHEDGAGHTWIDASLNFFSYYTILTNLAVAVSMTVLLISPASGLGQWFSRIGGQTALAGNMLVLSGLPRAGQWWQINYCIRLFPYFIFCIGFCLSQREN
jgi:hypothetical protein